MSLPRPWWLRSWPWAIGQVGLAFALAWPMELDPPATRWWVGLGLLVAATALLGWTLQHNRRGNWQVAPAVKAGARLVTTGPYRWVRHPMYLAVLLATGGVALFDATALDFALWITLGVLLAVKISVEEEALRNAFPEYGAYSRSAGPLWPKRF